ncbi:unnamed protein product, partial [Musa hybrid cultivar]
VSCCRSSTSKQTHRVLPLEFRHPFASSFHLSIGVEQMAHHREFIHPTPQSEQFPATSAADPPTYDFLQLPQNPLAQFHDMHEVVGHTQPLHPSNFMELQKWHLQQFWQQQMLELGNLADYKQHQLPLARIKRIMKLDGAAKMVSSDTPIIFAKACELFILELTVRSWLHAEQCKRLTIRRTDVAGAICHADMLNFLVDMLRPDEFQVFIRQPQMLQQHMMHRQQSYPNHILSEPPPPLVSLRNLDRHLNCWEQNCEASRDHSRTVLMEGKTPCNVHSCLVKS